jgi:hypothetical protein
MNPTRTFKLWHSLLITLALVLIESAIIYEHSLGDIRTYLILLIAIIAAVVNIYLATEVVEEVRGKRRMIVMLFAIMTEFVVFFAFQYWFMSLVQPASFPSLSLDPVSLLLSSVMVFVFNPIYLPATSAGRALLLIDTFGALGLVLFLLQNIGEFRGKSLDT